MARVTVEDCVVKIPNRFELVMLASQRARNIAAGAQLTVERDDDKNPVIALREIADETIDLDDLQNAMVQSLQKHVEIDEPEEDEMDILAIQEALNAEGGEADPAPATRAGGASSESPVTEAAAAKEATDTVAAPAATDATDAVVAPDATDATDGEDEKPREG